MNVGPVVIIEDDDAIAEALGELLTDEGFRIARASDGEAGLTLIRRARPLAVILDLTMPGMNGWDVLRELRRGVPLPVIITSSDVDPPAAGATEFILPKPYSIVDLLRILHALPPPDSDGELRTA